MIDPDGPFVTTWLGCLTAVTLVSLGATAFALAAERLLSRRARIFDVAVPSDQRRAERARYARFVVLLATIAAVWLHAGWIRFAGVDGPGLAVATFATQWVAFEVYYYGLHRALHTRALYRFHAPHHASRVTTAWTGQSLGVVEALGWIAGLVGPPTLMSLVTPLSASGLFVYFVANTFVNLAGHANVELSPIGRRGLTWLNHPWIYHSLHHARYRGHYSFVSTFMDRLFGTEWDDWPALHARVIGGEPLETLQARGFPAARMRSQRGGDGPVALDTRP